MNSELCQKYEAERAALIVDVNTGVPSPGLAAHLERCPRCREECQSLRRVAEALERAGDVLAEQLPVVDLVAAVQEGVRRVKSAQPESIDIDPVEAAMRIAYIEGDLDPFSSHRLEQRMAGDPALRTEIHALAAMHARMRRDADALQRGLPAIELTDAIMASIHTQHSEAPDTSAIPMEIQHALDAFMEDALPPEELVRLRRAAEDNVAVRAALRAAARLKGDLEAIGESIAGNAPKVDLIDDVMRDVRSAALTRRAPNAAKTRAGNRARPALFTAWQWAGLAAAACLVLGIGALTLWNAARLEGTRFPDRIARLDDVSRTTAAADQPQVLDDVSQGDAIIESVLPPIGRLTQEDIATPLPEDDSSDLKGKGISVQDIINARREAMLRDPKAITRMLQWGTLTAEEARGLIEEGGLSSEALAGVAQFLPPEEAAEILRRAVENNPNDPYLRAALAKKYAETDDGTAESLAELQAWSNLDPNNGMPHYMEARLYFEMNDYESGLNALTLASARTIGDPYSLQSARNRQEAFIASGMNPEAARLIAALSAGLGESRDAVAMAQQLLQYGQYYESMGDYDTAQQIYESIRQMGGQLVNGAALGYERQAGLEIQIQAVEAIQQIYAILQDPLNMRALEATYTGLVNSLSQVIDFLGQFEDLLNYASEDLIHQIAERILRQGNLSIFNIPMQ